MALAIGDTVPDFEAETTEGKICFHDWIGDNWVLLFAHPKDFNLVWVGEFSMLARLKPEFDKRAVKIIGVSVGSVDDQKKCASDIEHAIGFALNYPIVCDADRRISKLYGMMPMRMGGMLEDHTPAGDQIMRTVFIIGPDKKIKLMLVYPVTTEPNFDEIIRVIDSLQLTAKDRIATPANWKQGEDVILTGALTDDEMKYYPWGERVQEVRILAGIDVVTPRRTLPSELARILANHKND
jgi:alkyl hydroperoxide reductase subunit AhpC